jgi:Zn-finger nucleic acid-binding protein
MTEKTLSKAAKCPNCQLAMDVHRLPAHYDREVELDACKECRLLWVDGMESQQLTSDGVVELFRIVHQHAEERSEKLKASMGCVRCKSTLAKTHDRMSSTRFHYHACSKGHGRLITFYQFLAEKQFVRELSPAERAQVAADVKEIRCNGCGAPVDLAKHNACEYCRAPIAVFDRNAAQKAVEHYLARRHRVLPAGPPTPISAPQWSAPVEPSAYTAADLALDAVWAMSRFAMRSMSSRDAAPAAIPSLPTIAQSFDVGDSSGLLDLVSDGADSFLGSLFD